MPTGISWTGETWNPTTGCTHVSPGCDHCYAASLASGRLAHLPAYEGLAEGGRFNGTVRLLPDRLDQPLRWKRPRRIFVNSMSDLWHKDIPDEFLAKVFAVMALVPQHQFQILTKRPARMRSLLSAAEFREQVGWILTGMNPYWTADDTAWPLPNVWLGVSAEDQHWADIRIPALLDTPAAVRFVSAEPLLGPIDFHHFLPGPCSCHGVVRDGLDWVVVGGESGRGARPMHPDWARSIRDQCVAAGIAFHFKQWGK